MTTKKMLNELAERAYELCTEQEIEAYQEVIEEGLRSMVVTKRFNKWDPNARESFLYAAHGLQRFLRSAATAVAQWRAVDQANN